MQREFRPGRVSVGNDFSITIIGSVGGGRTHTGGRGGGLHTGEEKCNFLIACECVQNNFSESVRRRAVCLFNEITKRLNTECISTPRYRRDRRFVPRYV